MDSVARVDSKEKLFRPRAAIFDMDGLMLDTERPAIQLWIEASRHYGWNVDESVPLSTVGLDEASTREKVLAACGNHFPYEPVRAKLEDLYVELVNRDGIAHRPGLLVLLDRLTSLEVPLAVATSSSRESARWKLEKASILNRFSVLACGDEVSRGKPAPDIFLLAASRLGVMAEDCVAFEDSPAGLSAIAAAGMHSIFVKDLMEPPPEVLSKVRWRCRDLAEAASLFA